MLVDGIVNCDYSYSLSFGDSVQEVLILRLDVIFLGP